MYESDPLSKSLIEAAGRVLRREPINEAETTPTLKKGDKVKMTVYGKPRTGVVTDFKNSIVWVKMDDTQKTQWFHPESVSLLNEEMSDAQMKKREEIVKSMKDKEGDFKSRYGDKWKEVMYATATKMAMNEEKILAEVLK